MSVHERRGGHTRPASARRVIDAAKRLVPVLDLAQLLAGPTALRRMGADRWTALCPLLDHSEKTPSFVVYPEDRGWYCYGCLRGGDVVKLAAFAWGIDRADVAAAEVLLAFGHPVPARPDTWHAKQKRQEKARLALEQARIGRVQRRIYRWIFAPIVASFEDADERRAEEIAAWEDCGHIAFLIVQRAKEAA
jgi:CHC2 zinc finger